MAAKNLNHIPALDGLRGLAILLVLTYHYVGEVSHFAPGTLEAILVFLPKLGWCGVDLFFVLSGFLITRILYAAKDSSSYFKSFYGRRAVRILPVYFGFLALYLWVAPLFSPTLRDTFTAPDWVLWLFLSNFKGHSVAVNHFWSLAIEEQFYLLWPTLVVTFSKRTLLRIIALLTVIAFVSRFLLVNELTPLHPIKAYTLPFTHCDAILYGSAIALLTFDGCSRVMLRVFLGLALVGSGLFFLAVWLNGTSLWEYYTALFGYTGLALLFGGVLAFGVFGQRTSLLSSPFLCLLGKYSYAMYVLHIPFALLLEHFFETEIQFFYQIFGFPLLATLLLALVKCAVLLLLAMCSWRFYEKPFLRLKRHFPY